MLGNYVDKNFLALALNFEQAPPVGIVRILMHLPRRYPYCAWQRLDNLSKVSQSPLRLGYGGPCFALE